MTYRSCDELMQGQPSYLVASPGHVSDKLAFASADETLVETIGNQAKRSTSLTCW